MSSSSTDRPGPPRPGGAADAPVGTRSADIVHLDMDCFFASVEILDDPALAGRPLVVGGTGTRGVVCSASYEARAYGVRSAMPTGEARRLCPRAVFLPPRHDRYAEVSGRIREVMLGVTPAVEAVGLDEAYLDVRGAHRLLGDSREIAAGLRRAIASEVGLPCSVGVGTSKLVAKLASKAAKPVPRAAGTEAGCGVLVVEPSEELAFLHAHPASALPGVGPRTGERLRRFGVRSVGDLAAVPLESLVRVFGSAHGTGLHELANGIDRRRVEAERPTRSIGHEETFERDVRDVAELQRRAEVMAASVARRCRQSGLAARTVTVKAKTGDFAVRTRSRTLARATADAGALAGAAVSLVEAVTAGAPIRLLGVHVSSLVASAGEQLQQLELFGGEQADSPRVRRAEAAQALRDRLGRDAVVDPARLRADPPHRRIVLGPGPAR